MPDPVEVEGTPVIMTDAYVENWIGEPVVLSERKSLSNPRTSRSSSRRFAASRTTPARSNGISTGPSCCNRSTPAATHETLKAALIAHATDGSSVPFRASAAYKSRCRLPVRRSRER